MCASTIKCAYLKLCHHNFVGWGGRIANPGDVGMPACVRPAIMADISCRSILHPHGREYQPAVEGCARLDTHGLLHRSGGVPVNPSALAAWTQGSGGAWVVTSCCPHYDGLAVLVLRRGHNGELQAGLVHFSPTCCGISVVVMDSFSHQIVFCDGEHYRGIVIGKMLPDKAPDSIVKRSQWHPKHWDAMRPTPRDAEQRQKLGKCAMLLARAANVRQVLISCKHEIIPNAAGDLELEGCGDDLHSTTLTHCESHYAALHSRVPFVYLCTTMYWCGRGGCVAPGRHYKSMPEPVVHILRPGTHSKLDGPGPARPILMIHGEALGSTHGHRPGPARCKGKTGVDAESLIEEHYRCQDCTPVQCFGRRGDESVNSHVTVALTLPYSQASDGQNSFNQAATLIYALADSFSTSLISIAVLPGVKALASHQDRQNYIPGRVTSGFLHVIIVPDDGADQRVFLRISPIPCSSITALLHSHLISPSSTSKTSTFSGAQTPHSESIPVTFCLKSWVATGDRDMSINFLIASTRKALNWRAVSPMFFLQLLEGEVEKLGNTNSYDRHLIYKREVPQAVPVYLD
ncbi:hypothetical protein PR048_011528 [Dryococelus australis]|uniref:Uncharacterized protein n=1 Tax=Dryococelus australis TaxID=614101 RepID=A0ABQ9HLU0_9NEOP|nr:hypothetical protein PR048_011528 [Dryococelus australis]